MNDLSTPLTDEECDLLDRFLLERIDEEADTLDKDEGVLDISELDGLFTALVSGPISTVPSQWLPAVWGNFAPVWGSEKEFQKIFSLMIRHMNSIAHILMEFPEVFEPLFLEREVEGDTYTIVDKWCEGYRRGVELARKHWNEGGEEMAVIFKRRRLWIVGVVAQATSSQISAVEINHYQGDATDGEEQRF